MDGKTLTPKQLSQRVCAYKRVFVCANESHVCARMPRSVPKATPRSLSTIIARLAVEQSYFWPCAQSVLRPGLELRLQNIQVHHDRLPLNLLLQEEASYEVTASSNFYLVSLDLGFGKNKPSISPSPASPKVTSGPPSGLGRKSRGVPAVAFAGEWGGRVLKTPLKARMERQLYQITTWQRPSKKKKKKPRSLLSFRQLAWQTALVPQWLHHATPPGFSLMARSLCHLWCWSRGRAFFCWVPKSWSPPPASKLLAWQVSVLEILAGSADPACSLPTLTSISGVLALPSVRWSLCMFC